MKELLFIPGFIIMLGGLTGFSLFLWQKSYILSVISIFMCFIGILIMGFAESQDDKLGESEQ